MGLSAHSRKALDDRLAGVEASIRVATTRLEEHQSVGSVMERELNELQAEATELKSDLGEERR